MGVVNVTPDSFFEASRAPDPAAAVALARRHVDDGADLIDVGGESTRPGAAPVDPDAELARVLPVLEALRGEAASSIDTRHELVARAAVGAGAVLLNDVGGELAGLAGELGCGYVAMHQRGIPAGAAPPPGAPGLLDEVAEHVIGLARRARAAGATTVY